MSRPKLAVGFALFLVVLQIMGQPPLYVSLPLMFFAVFLVVWGIAPNEMRRLIIVLPYGAKIWHGLCAIESRFSADIRQKDEARIKLAEFLDSGRALFNRCNDETIPAPEGEAQIWLDELILYVENCEILGASYIPRLNNPHGLPPRYSTAHSRDHSLVAGNIYTRLLRIEQFLQELSRE